MTGLLEQFKAGVSQMFRTIRGADEERQAVAIEGYEDLVEALADAVHAGRESGISTEEIVRVRDEAGKTEDDFETDVQNRLKVLVNQDIIRQAEEHKENANRAQAELERLKKVALPEAQRAVDAVKREIQLQERVIKKQIKMNLQRMQAESENVNLYQGHLRTQRAELKEWLLTTTEKLNALRKDRDSLLARIGENELRLEAITDGSGGHIRNSLVEDRDELAELDARIADLQAQWDEGKRDHRAIVDQMRQG